MNVVIDSGQHKWHVLLCVEVEMNPCPNGNVLIGFGGGTIAANVALLNNAHRKIHTSRTHSHTYADVLVSCNMCSFCKYNVIQAVAHCVSHLLLLCFAYKALNHKRVLYSFAF